MTLDEILDEYAKKRSKAISIAESKEREYYSGSADLKQKRDEMRRLALSYMKGVLSEGESPDRERAKSEIAKLKTAAPTFSPQYECPLCGDTGYIFTQSGAQMCDCLLERMYTDIYGGQAISSLKGDFSRFDESIFKEEKQLEDARYVRGLLLDYIRDFPKNSTRVVLFQGEAGLGKTFMMGALARELYKKTRRVLFIDSFSLFKAFHRNRLGELDALDPIFDADVLMIDDLGTEPFTQNVTREYFFKLLEHRTFHKLHTFATTNLNYQGLKDRYTEKSVSRMLSNVYAAVLDFNGVDLRIRG